MTLFIQNDATGAGAGSLDPNQAFVDLAIIANGDTGLGLALPAGNRQRVTYARTDPGTPPVRLSNLVNTNFNVNPQNVDIVILPVLANFTLNDGTSILSRGGVTLPPAGSGQPGAALNSTTSCLVIYDTTQNSGNGYCTARAGTSGVIDLQTPNPVILYHELSHAFRTVTNALLALTAACNPASPEENAAITDENNLRTQQANAIGTAPVLRDPLIHCGGLCTGGAVPCCIVASVASGSPLSAEVAGLRSVRDGLLRKSEIGFTFFESLHRGYYAFSPQVCTLMAQNPSLRPLVLEGFVRPLVSVLQMVEWWTGDSDDVVGLGERFVEDHADRTAAAARLDLIERARGVLGGNDAELTIAQGKLAELLAERALTNEHVRWALVEPIQLYEAVLHSYVNGWEARQLGDQLFAEIGSWAPRMPLDGVWGSLSAAELRDELALLEGTLFRTAASRATFRDRLERAFGTATAVAAVLREDPE